MVTDNKHRYIFSVKCHILFREQNLFKLVYLNPRYNSNNLKPKLKKFKNSF